MVVVTWSIFIKAVVERRSVGPEMVLMKVVSSKRDLQHHHAQETHERFLVPVTLARYLVVTDAPLDDNV